MKTSARPWTPIPIGLWRRFDFLSEDEGEPLEEVDDAFLAAQVAAAQAVPDPDEEDDPEIIAEQTILFDVGDGQDVELGNLSMVQLFITSVPGGP